MLHAQEIIAHGLALLLCGVQHAIQLRPDARALRYAAALPRLALQLLLQLALQAGRIHTSASQHGAQHAAFLLHQRQQQLCRVNLSPPGRLRCLLRGLQAFHEFCSKIIIHHAGLML